MWAFRVTLIEERLIMGNVTDLFMHPQSGDIQSMSDWIEDSKDWEGDIPSQLATLLPVDDQYQN
jgi:energy-converting hydrogenase A subunit M